MISAGKRWRLYETTDAGTRGGAHRAMLSAARVTLTIPSRSTDAELEAGRRTHGDARRRVAAALGHGDPAEWQEVAGAADAAASARVARAAPHAPSAGGAPVTADAAGGR
jgi:hypothetical protein